MAEQDKFYHCPFCNETHKHKPDCTCTIDLPQRARSEQEILNYYRKVARKR